MRATARILTAMQIQAATVDAPARREPRTPPGPKGQLITGVLNELRSAKLAAEPRKRRLASAKVGRRSAACASITSFQACMPSVRPRVQHSTK